MKYFINFSSIDRVKKRQTFALNFLIVILIVFFTGTALIGIKKIGDISNETTMILNEKIAIEETIAKSIEERRRFISDEEVKQINEKIAFYKEVYDKRFFVTSFLTVLEDILIGGVTLKSLDVDITRKNFLLSGEGLNPESAVIFSKKIADIPYIKNAQISKQNFQRFGEKKILISDFEIKGDMY